MKNEEIKFYGTTWCPDCYRSKYVLDKLNIKYSYINIDEDPYAAEYVEQINNGYRSVPTIIFPDGTKLVEPNADELVKQLMDLE